MSTTPFFELPTATRTTEEMAEAVPVHVAIIMDGNGRWAQQRGLPRTEGHRAGVRATRRAVEFLANQGVRVLTLFAFSSENWERPKTEVHALLRLFVAALEDQLEELAGRGIRLQFIGDRMAFPATLQQWMSRAEAQTRQNDRLVLVVALGYGGRWDLQQAAQRWCAQALAQQSTPDPQRLPDFLSTAGLPEVDLLIRTGGEQRLSNFLLWQAAYAELDFLDVFWPDVAEADLDASLRRFARRQRRFGRAPHSTA